MNYYAASALANSAVMTLLFFVLLFKKEKPRAAKFFNLLNFTGICWAVPYYFWQISTDYNSALLYVKLLMVGAILAAPALFHFTTVIVEKEKDLLEVIIFCYLVAFAFIFLNFFSNNFVAGLETKLSIPFFPTAGKYYIFYLLQWVLVLAASFWLLYQKSKEVDGEEKEFVDVLLISNIISFGGAAMNYFLWYNIPIPPVTTLITGMYAVTGTILLLQGKFYKINLFYFEYFAGITILASMLQFVLSRQLPQQYVSIIIIFIILLATAFLVRNSKIERENLEKIKLLNKRLSESLKNMINSIDACVIILSKNLNVEVVNEAAKKFFCPNKEACPKKFFDLVNGNTNKALVYALDDYQETGKTSVTTTILSPVTKNVDLFFSPFTLNDENDSVMIIIKDRSLPLPDTEPKKVYEH